MAVFSNIITMLPAINHSHSRGLELAFVSRKSTSLEKPLPPSRKTVASSTILQVALGLK